MSYIGKQPAAAALTASDITDGIISTAKIAADAITAAKIPDDAISDEHLDATAITGQTALTVNPATTDEVLLNDGGSLKRISMQNIGNYPAFKACHNAAQTISHNTVTQIAWSNGTAPLNPNTIWGSNTFTVPTGGAGHYMFSMMWCIGNEPTDDIYYVKPMIYVNDGNRGQMVRQWSSDDDKVSVVDMSWTWGGNALSEGDTIKGYVLAKTVAGGDVSMHGSAFRNLFMGWRIAGV